MEEQKQTENTVWNNMWKLYHRALLLSLLPLLVLCGFGLFEYTPPAFFVTIITLVFVYRKASILFIQEVGRKYGLTPFMQESTEDFIAGRMLETGDGRTITDVLEGTIEGRPAHFFHYSFSTGSGKHKTTSPFAMFRIVFENTTFPFLLLQANTTPQLWAGDSRGFVRDVLVPLEPEFAKEYTLHAVQGYETEALQIFTPDTLRLLIEQKGKQPCSILFGGNAVYVYVDNYIFSEATFEILYKTTQVFLQTSASFLDRLHDDFKVLEERYKE